MIQANDIGTSATTKYFYVTVSGTINGVSLIPVTSNVAALTIKAKPTVNINAPTMAQTVYVNQTTSLPSFSVNVTPITGATFTYQWYSNASNSTTNGTAIQDATNSSYMISSNDIGTTATTKYFYVTASGTINGITLDSVTSDVFSLNVKTLPTIAIKTPPTPQTVFMNQTSAFPTFSVVATPIENATFTYQWYSNASNSTTGGTAIQGATKANYEISASDIGTTANSVKYFYVTVGGSIGDIKLTSVTSDAVSLTTKADSTITISTQPTAEQVVAKNASVTLTTTATTTSSSELSYQWQKSNKVSTNPVWTNIEGANSSTYTFSATDEPGTITYYRVIVSEAITNATTTSSEAKVSVGYADVATATAVLNTWLSNQTNQKNLLSSYFTKGNVNPLSILTSSNASSLGIQTWGYNFNTLPTAVLNSITHIPADTTNALPADTWEIKATTTGAGTYQEWNATSSAWGENVAIPVGTVFTFYLPFSFSETITVTGTPSSSGTASSATITRTVSVANGSSTISFVTSTRIPWDKIKVSFTPLGTNSTTINLSFSQPEFYSFSNTNSDLPAYPIVATSSSR